MGTKKNVESPFPLPDDIDPDVYLLLGDPNHESLGRLHRYVLPVGGAIVAGTARLLGQKLTSRPFYTGMHITALYLLGGVAFGEWGYRKKAQWSAERDLQYLHYISLHPEDFKAKERVLYRDYLSPWHPFR